MITWLVGDNTFERHEAEQALESAFKGVVERVDGLELTLAALPDLLMGMSLFTEKRLVIISNLSQNGAVWEKLPEWLPRQNDDIHLVLIDTKPDKRTTSYKALRAAADIQEFPAYGERDTHRLVQWVESRASQRGIALNRQAASRLVSRVGNDQWQLAHALDMLSLLDQVTPAVIDEVIPPNVHENIFQLFETALEGKPQQVADMIRTLSIQEDPYALFALLSSQVLTLAAVTYPSGGGHNPAKEFGIHPFVASKLTRHGSRLGPQRVGLIVAACARTDADLKRSKAEPWMLIERLLLEIAQQR